jgi:hypothetical protein
MTIDQRRLEILRGVESGAISTLDGAKMLEALESGFLETKDTPMADPIPVQSLAPSPEPVPTPVAAEKIEVLPIHKPFPEELSSSEVARLAYGRRWWLVPFGLGVVIGLMGAYWMYLGFLSAGLGWGFWLSWFPFGFGVLIMAIAARSRSARWLHVRIRQKPGNSPQNITISMPLPLSLASWFLRTFGRWLPGKVNGMDLGDTVSMFDQAITSDAPLHVQVDDDGEQVEVFIG